MWFSHKGIKKVLLIILDGFGIANPWGGNAIFIARLPNWNSWLRQYPHASLLASGHAVGLSGHEIGNSEVGHLTIGAGRVLPQDSSRINQEIADGSFFQNKVLIDVFNLSKLKQRPVHLMGLLSDGGVHASYNHLEALLEMAVNQHVTEINLHLFTDGRDTLEDNGINLLKKLESFIGSLLEKQRTTSTTISNIHIASISGRYFAMDRDRHLERINKAVKCITEGICDISNSPSKVLADAYNQGKTDEYVLPTIILDKDGKTHIIKNGDPIIFFNFRSDRAREICQDLVIHNPNSLLVTFIPYGFSQDSGVAVNTVAAFKFPPVENGLTACVSHHNIKQLHIAETEKYAHVTYFFNLGVESQFPLEDRMMVPSPRVAYYATTPEMSAIKIKDQLIKTLKYSNYQFIVANFANADMLGHTGNLRATVKALEIVDKLLGEIVTMATSRDWFTVITSDHGNAEQLVNPLDGSPDPEHTTNNVPLIILPPQQEIKIDIKRDGSLSDVAPTVLELLGIEKPQEMTGSSLIIKKEGVNEDSDNN